MILRHDLSDDVLPDSTAWIDYFNPRAASPEKEFLGKLIEKGNVIWICPPVFQEILQGAKSGKAATFYKSFLLRCRRGRMGIYKAAELAAEIYRTLRPKGVTIRKPNDCLIAAYALLNNLALLHHDKDFDPIEKYFGLKVVS
ncbi:MAG: PIN domain-containing protein [Spirochaetaceae bacterium]|jgi:predicted nucleic acid-binding protein|nr:PIN domain-containing protein [Spirochaetaceae bacterium]